MLKAKGLLLVAMTFLFVLTTGQAQAKNIDLSVINEGVKVNGYKLKLEIRWVNDPIYEHEIDLDIPALTTQHFQLNVPLEKHIPTGSVPASNTIVHLLKDGHVLATYHYAAGYRVDELAGYLVKLDTSKIKPNEIHSVTEAISIVPTDAEGKVLLTH